MDANLEEKKGSKGGVKLGANYGTRKMDAIVETITNEKEDVKVNATKVDENLEAKLDTNLDAKLDTKGMQKI